MLLLKRPFYDVPFVDPPPADVTQLMCQGFDLSAAAAACDAPPLSDSQRATIQAAFAVSSGS